MAQDPDLQIYRRFDNLASKALLYQESELQYLQDELNKLENDEEKNDALPDYRSVKWTVLESTSLDPQSLGHEQAIRRVTLVRRLQMAMKDYRQFDRAGRRTSARTDRMCRGSIDPPVPASQSTGSEHASWKNAGSRFPRCEPQHPRRHTASIARRHVPQRASHNKASRARARRSSNLSQSRPLDRVPRRYLCAIAERKHMDCFHRLPMDCSNYLVSHLDKPTHSCPHQQYFAEIGRRQGQHRREKSDIFL